MNESKGENRRKRNGIARGRGKSSGHEHKDVLTNCRARQLPAEPSSHTPLLVKCSHSTSLDG